MEGFGKVLNFHYCISITTAVIFCSMGMACAVFIPFLLNFYSVVVLLVISVLLLYGNNQYRSCAGWMLVGALYSALHAGLVMSHWLPDNLDGQEITITGYVTDFPRSTERGWQFDFYSADMHGKIRLGSYDESFKPVFDEQYEMLVKLKRPRGLLNFNQYDYQAWLLQSGYLATGYVRHVVSVQARNPGFFLRLRSNIAESIRNADISEYSRSTLLGLLIGSYADIDVLQWHVLRDTGTIHLLSVSGLHIAMVAALVYFCIVRVSCALTYPLRWLPSEYWGAIAGLSFAIFYAVLSGLSVATQRSLIMVAVSVFQRLLYGRFYFGSSWIVSLFLVLLVNPLSVMSAGFWFSFLATAVLLVSNYGWIRKSSWIENLLIQPVKIQFLVFIIVSPILLYVYGRVPLLSLPMNFIAVPWVSFVSLPSAFVAMLVLPVCESLGNMMLKFSAWTLDIYWMVMEIGVKSGNHLQWEMGGVGLGALILMLVGLSIFFLCPRGFKLRWCALLMCLPLLLPRQSHLAGNQVELTVLDVGQGLAIIVRTAKHVLVYDVGDHSSDRFDAGRDIVAPALRNLRADKIDMLMISHADSDHAAGRKGLFGEFRAMQLWSGTPEQLSGPESFLPCRSGMQWHWDGVFFKVLAPDMSEHATDNNRGCVLLIAAGNNRLLLTGDIEAAAEQTLVNSGVDMQADVLVAPHHGSKTSSSPAFLAAVNPRKIIVSAGFRNRFRHPADLVVKRYEERGASVLNTAELGAVRMLFSADGMDIRSALCEQRFFWRAERYNAHCQSWQYDNGMK